MKTQPQREAFLAAIEALQPYMSDIVLVGGWVPLIYHHRYREPVSGAEPPGTTDVDVVLPRRLPARDRPPIEKVVLQAGYEPALSSMVGETRPRSTFQRTLPDGTVSEIELLTSARGERRGLVQIGGQEPLAAEALPFHNILLENRLELELDSQFDASISKPLLVSIPTPTAFVYVKGLTWERREELAKRAKDLTYLFDLLDRYPTLRAEVTNELPALFGRYPARWAEDFRDSLGRAFETRGSRGSRAVAEQLIAGGLGRGSVEETAGRVSATMRAFLAELS